MNQPNKALPPSILVGILGSVISNADAAPVQISLINNQISSAGNFLFSDLTGDGNPDVSFSWPFFSAGSVRVYISGNPVSAQYYGGSVFNLDAQFVTSPAGVGTPTLTGSIPASIHYLNPITFTDANINSGNPTDGWLHVNSFNSNTTFQTVKLVRLIFDDSSTTRPTFSDIPGDLPDWTIPEPSGLALLALGAGGLLWRRRRKLQKNPLS